MKGLEGKVALITGASRGIGRATALAMARAGARVAVVARTEPELQALSDQVRALDREVTLSPIWADGTSFDQLQRLLVCS